MTSAISSLAKILEIQSSPSARFLTQESMTSTLNTKSTPGSSPNILNGDMNVNVKKLIHVNEDTDEHQIKKQSNNDHENSESKAIMQKVENRRNETIHYKGRHYKEQGSENEPDVLGTMVGSKTGNVRGTVAGERRQVL
ncbi:hypothetical protein PIB30_037881 [Stylosanthes scabra]|uniref:Uncharacterized protein n=1 Tax=Stylosanthes scabra TaxID=79078 RepID=A0ABU6YCH9_9FABA|nr:hypothetical protein [Stylosanthes scabra]